MIVTEEGELAICQVLPAPSFPRMLEAQQLLTTTLRQALGERAETVPVFVVTGGPGDDVEDCATAWGATSVVEARTLPARFGKTESTSGLRRC